MPHPHRRAKPTDDPTHDAAFRLRGTGALTVQPRRLADEYPDIFDDLTAQQCHYVAVKACAAVGNDVWAVRLEHLQAARDEVTGERR